MKLVGVDVAARGVSVRGPRGMVFENVDVDVPSGGLLVVHGAAGSGRTSLLLALAGRMRFVAGTVRVGGHVVPGAAGRVRELVAVALAEPAVGLEGRLRVAELITERRLIGGVDRAAVQEAFGIVGIDPPGKSLVEELDSVTALLLAVALTLAERPAAMVVDDVGLGCPSAVRAASWEALERVRATGCTMLTGSTDAPAMVPEHETHTVRVDLPRRSIDRFSAVSDKTEERRA